MQETVSKSFSAHPGTAKASAKAANVGPHDHILLTGHNTLSVKVYQGDINARVLTYGVVNISTACNSCRHLEVRALSPQALSHVTVDVKDIIVYRKVTLPWTPGFAHSSQAVCQTMPGALAHVFLRAERI